MDKNLKIKIIVMIICTCILSASILAGSKMISQSIQDVSSSVDHIDTDNGEDPLDANTFELVMQKVIDAINGKTQN